MVLPGFEVEGPGSALVAGAVLGVLNFAIGWLLFTIIAIGTLGIGFVLSLLTKSLVMAVLLKVADALLDGLTIRSFRVAFVAGIVLALMGTVSDLLVRGV